MPRLTSRALALLLAILTPVQAVFAAPAGGMVSFIIPAQASPFSMTALSCIPAFAHRQILDHTPDPGRTRCLVSGLIGLGLGGTLITALYNAYDPAIFAAILRNVINLHFAVPLIVAATVFKGKRAKKNKDPRIPQALAGIEFMANTMLDLLPFKEDERKGLQILDEWAAQHQSDLPDEVRRFVTHVALPLHQARRNFSLVRRFVGELQKLMYIKMGLEAWPADQPLPISGESPALDAEVFAAWGVAKQQRHSFAEFLAQRHREAASDLRHELKVSIYSLNMFKFRMGEKDLNVSEHFGPIDDTVRIAEAIHSKLEMMKNGEAIGIYLLEIDKALHALRASKSAFMNAVHLLAPDEEVSLERSIGYIDNRVRSFIEQGGEFDVVGNPQRLNVAYSISTALETEEIRDLKGRIQITFSPPLIGITPAVYIDLYLAQEIWLNLIRNAAIHSGKPFTHLLILVLCEDDGVGIYFSDDGIGISPENRNRIFTKGFSTRLGAGGEGRGLALLRKIVENAGGSIEFISRPGNTTFKVHLPFADRAELERRLHSTQA